MNLLARMNQEALTKMNWREIHKLKKEGLELWEIFPTAICNARDCPIGYSECGGKTKFDCHFYNILEEVLG